MTATVILSLFSALHSLSLSWSDVHKESLSIQRHIQILPQKQRNTSQNWMYPLSGFEVMTKAMHVPWKPKQNVKWNGIPLQHPQFPEVTVPSGFECSTLVRYANSHTQRQENQMSDEEICLSRCPIKKSGTLSHMWWEVHIHPDQSGNLPRRGWDHFSWAPQFLPK